MLSTSYYIGFFSRFFFFFSEGLIRVAFQSLQLVVTDFLPLMPCTCIKVVVDVAGKFGLQPQELNISLTAIGLLVSYVTYCLGFVRECSYMITTALSFKPRFSTRTTAQSIFYVSVKPPPPPNPSSFVLNLLCGPIFHGGGYAYMIFPFLFEVN